jgi:hypothetical protein
MFMQLDFFIKFLFLLSYSGYRFVHGILFPAVSKHNEKIFGLAKMDLRKKIIETGKRCTFS